MTLNTFDNDNYNRSAARGESLADELMESYPGSVAVYLKVDVSKLGNVDAVCEEIQKREEKLNILFLTAGHMDPRGRNGKPSYSLAKSDLQTEQSCNITP